ncbi:MAG TPA: hypothetical protein DCS60_00320 [Opitutae bacterium]|nr:hypothetical protein [Opitutae bacterium]
MFIRLLKRATMAARASVVILATSLLASSQVDYGQSRSSVFDLQKTIQEIYQDRKNAVVRVKVATETLSESNEPKVVLRVFSGFFISEKGQVLTSYLPTDNATRVWIEKGGISFLADIVGSDARTNVALLQVINLPDSFDYIKLIEEKKSLEIGALAFSVTSPLDFSPTPKFGLVTGYESHFAEVVFPLTYTRLSISIGPAEGGSPALDANNELIGIVMATLPEVDSSYIIPVRALTRIVSQLTKYQEVRYGLLPIDFEEKPDTYNIGKRVLVKSIFPGSHAERSGLQPGDEILNLEGSQIADLNNLRDSIFFKDPGDFLLFTIKRDQKELDFAILLEPEDDHIVEGNTVGSSNN